MMITSEIRSSWDTAELPVHIKKLNNPLKNQFFAGNDPIKSFHFLIHFFNEVEMLNMSESQAFIDMPSFLTHPAET